MSRFIIRRAKAEDGAALCAIYAPYITDTTITFEYEVPTDAAFSDRIRETAAQFPYLVCEKDGGIIGYAYAHRIRERAAYDWDAELSVYLKQGAASARCCSPASSSCSRCRAFAIFTAA